MRDRLTRTWRCFSTRVKNWWWRGGNPMGRSAVGNVLVWMMWPAFTALIPGAGTASPSLETEGPLQDAWAVLTIIAALIFIGSFVPKDPQDKRVMEMAALGLLVITNVAYAFAIEQITGIRSPLAQSLAGALATACVGRAFLLLRCWFAVRHSHKGIG